MAYLASIVFSRTFPLNFWFLPVFDVVFIVNDLLYCLTDNFGVTNIFVVTLGHNVAYLMAFVESN